MKNQINMMWFLVVFLIFVTTLYILVGEPVSLYIYCMWIGILILWILNCIRLMKFNEWQSDVINDLFKSCKWYNKTLKEYQDYEALKKSTKRGKKK